MKTAIKLVIMTALPVVVLAWLLVYEQRVKSAFPAIEPGMSSAEVDQAFGVPPDVSPCGKWGGDQPAGCVKQYAYPSLTGIWLVSFDAGGKVIGKLRLNPSWLPSGSAPPG